MRAMVKLRAGYFLTRVLGVLKSQNGKLYIAAAKQAYVLCHLHMRRTICEPMPTLAMDDVHLPNCSNGQCREVSEQ